MMDQQMKRQRLLKLLGAMCSIGE
ncbi:hypothetical protein LCGC14_1460560, partial [marine sediment metagenome]